MIGEKAVSDRLDLVALVSQDVVQNLGLGLRHRLMGYGKLLDIEDSLSQQVIVALGRTDS